MALIEFIRHRYHLVQAKMAKVLGFIFSVVFYFIGLGGTSLVSKIFRQRFLETSFATSAWKNARKETILTKQY